MTETAVHTDQFAADWEAWHRAHEQRRADKHGFLAITELHWLSSEPERFDDSPGEWSTGPDGVVVDLGPDEEIVVAGAAARGRYSFGVIPRRGGVNAVWGDAV